ncbi:YegP family protein [Kitasatospora viridis]|uniref:Uncharacterized protein YegP (UPF0339 family) n=1 Tax=Kitasatospora viridis TaxID=281105 RepID=A0A561UH39_9ACTN|nr:DUF1508 domain-containing protein [Kitasatospora viridis]TWF98672.1 uncharacterized protein YegP (UPF0339 family) [Kitasatospora viridis]
MGLVGQVGGGRAGAEAVRGGFQIERAANGRYQWQLKAPNGRIVAVSSPVFETVAEAGRAFGALREEAAGLTARITHVRDGIGWIWVVPGPRGLPEARSSRAYERYATCQNAFRRFVALMERQSAPPPDEPPPPEPSPSGSSPSGPTARERSLVRTVDSIEQRSAGDD